jgi:hypothetical protein
MALSPQRKSGPPMLKRANEESQLALPFEYLTSASENSLRNFENVQLAHFRNLEKEIEVMRQERDKAKLLAEMARLLIEHRARLLRHVGDHLLRANAELPEPKRMLAP